MAKASSINQWLSAPNSFLQSDEDELSNILEKYPYFSPGQYVHAAQKQRQQAFQNELLEKMQLFQGNWILFIEYLNACETLEQPILAPIEEHGLDQPLVLSDAVIEETPVVNEAAPEAVEILIPAKHEIEIEKRIYEDSKQINLKSNSTSEEFGKPIFSEDYFLYQGIEIPEVANMRREPVKEDKSLMVVMSFSEWLMHFKTKNERDKQEKEDKKALKTMWQKEKLAAALEEENEEIPEEVFNMAVNSITKEDGLASESLAEILQKQGKFDKALDMYRKLSLRNPQKSAYFATKIEQINKQLEL